MQRAVIDTHCLVASVGPRSPFRALYDLFAAQAFEWVISNEILTEYEEQVMRRYSVGTAQQVHEVLTTASNTYFKEAHYKWQLIEADPDDNKFVDVAVAANADLLITNDRHFEVLRQIEFPRVTILSLPAFLADFQ